jgi:hypothetical protein
MALTHAVTESTDKLLAYLVTRAGGAGTTDTILQADLAADALAKSNIKGVLTATYTTDALVQAALQGIGQAASSPNVPATWRCRIGCYQVSGTIGALAAAGAAATDKATIALIGANVDAVYWLGIQLAWPAVA